MPSIGAKFSNLGLWKRHDMITMQALQGCFYGWNKAGDWFKQFRPRFYSRASLELHIEYMLGHISFIRNSHSLGAYLLDKPAFPLFDLYVNKH